MQKEYQKRDKQEEEEQSHRGCQQPASPAHAPKVTLCKTTMTIYQVDGKVDGVVWPMVVDTGSEQTLVRSDAISHRQLLETSHRLWDITGHCGSQVPSRR